MGFFWVGVGVKYCFGVSSYRLRTFVIRLLLDHVLLSLWWCGSQQLLSPNQTTGRFVVSVVFAVGQLSHWHISTIVDYVQLQRNMKKTSMTMKLSMPTYLQYRTKDTSELSNF